MFVNGILQHMLLGIKHKLEHAHKNVLLIPVLLETIVLDFVKKNVQMVLLVTQLLIFVSKLAQMVIIQYQDPIFAFQIVQQILQLFCISTHSIQLVLQIAHKELMQIS